ncbi:beta-1,3-galactosyltransferase 1 [Dermacentor silvarum]|uniref:beta-1,3-galactosyltransferase 1 n=1 Tax=Dermacentor silvarum TaxID=543639 RepID=UPI00189B5AE1|nr:beta-1,3-galactosyltransferase 1 [Dermacentor silvarum]
MWSLRKRRFARFAAAGVTAVTVLASLAHFSSSATRIHDSRAVATRRQSSAYPPPVPLPSQAAGYKESQQQPLHRRTFPGSRVYSQPFEYLVNQERLCRGNRTDKHGHRIDYLFLISSAMGNVDRRNAIRGTWGRDVLAFTGNRLAFLLGAGSDSRLQSAVESEASVHGDVIQEAFFDSYRNVTLKSIMMLRWTTQFCPGARFVVKVDDDTYLNAGNFFAAMQSRSADAIYGKLYRMSQPIRDRTNKWYVTSDEYPRDTYPDYVGGSAYVIGGDVIDALYRATGHVKPFPIEDAYITGSCAESIGARRVQVEGFNSLRIESVCEVKRAVTAHYTTAKEMFALRDQLQNTEFVCQRLLFDFAYFCYCRKSSAVT